MTHELRNKIMTKFFSFTAAALLGLGLAGSSAQAANEPSLKTAQQPYGFSNGYGYPAYGQPVVGSPCRSGRCGLQSYGMPAYGTGYYGGLDSSFGSYGSYGTSNQYLGSGYSTPGYGMQSGGGAGGGYGGQFGPSGIQSPYSPNQYSPSPMPPAPYLSNQFGPSMNSGYSSQSFSQPYSGYGQPGSSYTQPMAGFGPQYPSYNQGFSGQGMSGFGVSQPGFGQPLNSYSQPASSPFYP